VAFKHLPHYYFSWGEGGGANFSKNILINFLAKSGDSKYFSVFLKTNFFLFFFLGGGTGPGVVPNWFGGLIYTFDGRKKPPVKFQNSSLPPSRIGPKIPKKT
jgi:hypothetical protein